MTLEDPPDDLGGPKPPDLGEPELVGDVPAADEEGATEAYQQRARLAEDRLAEVLAAYRDFRRETEAYRDRLTRQLQRKFEQRHETLLLKFIDILDNFDRALEAAQSAGDSLVEGLILVRTQLLQMLQEEGLERIPVLGLPFDPHVAEAVGRVPVEDAEQHDVVMQEMLRGYRLNGRIARPSQVMIGEYAGAEATKPAAPSRKSREPLIGVAAPPAEAREPVAAPPPDEEALDEGRGGPSLDEIIARAEARDEKKKPKAAPAPPAVLYDDLTELPEAVEEVRRGRDAETDDEEE